MKKIIILSLHLFFTALLGQNKEVLSAPKVDVRVELLSIVFRLAECPEYTAAYFPKYIDKIEKHFGNYKEHELIKFTQSKLVKGRIRYDAVMFMAIALSDNYPFVPLRPITNEFPESRWTQKKAEKFIELLNAFYVDADCASFFERNKDIYEHASREFKTVFNELDVQWYPQFYGEMPKGKFNIVTALGNGGHNYGPNIEVDGIKNIYAIMGTWSIDSLGLPKYESKSYFSTLVHEFNHSFVNHLVYQSTILSSKSGKKIFKHLEDKMKSQAYTSWQIMYAESIVRAGVIKYFIDHKYDEEYIHFLIMYEKKLGFLWIDGLVKKLKEYDENRSEYPTLEKFMPEISVFFDDIAKNITTIQNEFEEKKPKIIRVTPNVNNKKNVSPKLKRIEIYFDRPLLAKGYSINYGDKGKETFPKIEKIDYTEDHKTLLLDLFLEPQKEYQFILTGIRFKTVEGYGINDYEIRFKTE